ncbi:MAG: Fe-S cluster assembly ATPase SufC [Thaumarchaeota archaeon]|nr:MAG: Fe-S cluster assembly ATPase SufC [Nitrososphaerota archaeon]
MLKIENLHVSIDGRLVLRGVDLEIGDGEIHVLFGPNGSGKTSLVMSILGYPGYRVLSGKISFDGVDITDKPMDERVRMGIGVVFQNPPKIYGIRLKDLIKVVSKSKMNSVEISGLMDRLNIDSSLLNRYLNVGFSGGEIKRSEIAQVLTMKPKFVILDEPDSGVDLDNLQLIGRELAENLRDKSGLIITHHGYILKYVKPVKAHVMINGVIVCDGEPEKILNRIKESGYRWCRRCYEMRRSERL